jgi:carboxyl-terminal processing protease
LEPISTQEQQVPRLSAQSAARGQLRCTAHTGVWPRARKLMVGTLVAASLCVLPQGYAGRDAPPAPAQKPSAIERISAMLEQIRARYVEPIDDDKLVNDALNGVLKGLDPYSKYMNAEAFEQLQGQNRGEYGGLGLEVRMEQAGARVNTTFEDAPAHRAGLKPGDLITRIDEASLEGLSLEQVTDRMRGKPDTEITLTVLRKGLQDPEAIKIKRALVRWQSVRGRILEPGIGYLRITNFQEHTGEMLATTVERMWKENDGPMRGIVLDLRDNPGGLLTAAVAVCAAFLPANAPVVSADGQGQTSKMRLFASKSDYLKSDASDYLANLPAELKTVPLVVLVNKNSASSSEIVAGALQDNKRASVIGTKTFGKGSIQRMYPQQDGSGLKITTSYYYTPGGRKVQGQGIQPDVAMEREPAAVAKLDAPAKADAPQNVALDAQVAQVDAKAAAQACSLALRTAGNRAVEPQQIDEEPDCQLSEAVRMLRRRTKVSQS